MSDIIEPLKFFPAINRAKPIDMLMVYPTPCVDSPNNLTPLSIMYPGKMFEDQGMSVKYIDLRWDSQEMLEDMLRESAQVGISCFTGYQCGRAADIAIRAKEINPKITVNIGGHHARMVPEDVRREPFVDVVWPERSYHEQSFPFSEECQRLWSRGDLQYITSSGCPYACSFCALRSAWEPRDMDKMRDEMEAICALRPLNKISFTDPNIGFDRTRINGKMERVDRMDRLRGIGAIMRSHGLRYACNVRADYITPEMVEAMHEGGCYSVEFGAESGNDEFLRKVIRKGHGVDANRQANRCMAGSGISVMNSFIRGMPRETHEQWLDTMNFIDEIMVIAPEARASVYRFVPYPGGPAYDDAVAGIGIAKFDPPKTMKEWGAMKLMVDPTYWVAGLCFRLDNTLRNFPGEDWNLIEPYVLEARKLWKERRPEDFQHSETVENLIGAQVKKHTAEQVTQ